MSTTARAKGAPSRERVKALAARLYAERRSYLLGIAIRNSVNPADAEEALQEAFVSFIGAFDPDGPAPPLPWLILTLKRQCWARRRHEQLDRRAGQPCGGEEELDFRLESIPDRASSPEELAALADTRELLAALKPDHRRALGLKAMGYSYREIGEITGWTLTKTNRCLVEGRARLRGLSRS
jgi:RNA polymerase sigma factor (sigma-70 family)